MVVEMMYRTGERFSYFRCSECHSISRVGTPGDLAKYYDSDVYYSFDDSQPNPTKAMGLRQRLMQRRDAGELFDRMPNRLLSQWKPNPALADLKRYIACVQNPTPTMSVLDVGCGNGALVHRMRNAGFRNVVGIDPFLPENDVANRSLRQSRLCDVEGSDFDLIMMHHVLEHDDIPADLLSAAKNRLNRGGAVLVRVPIVSLSTWDKFGKNWAELDPPRHSYLPTVSALEKLGQSVGLHVHRVDYEAEPFTFAASEKASQGQAFANETSQENFSAHQWQGFQDMAMQFAIVGQSPRIAIHFCQRPAVGPILRLAVPTFGPIDVSAVPIQETYS